MIDLLVFIFGLIIGSFLNVVIYRYNTGHTLAGRSKCLSCGTPLKWHHLIPLFSYLAQRGRCAHCGSKISPQYAIVEIFTGILFLGAYWSVNTWGELVMWWALLSLLVVIAAYDLRHKIIPDALVYAFGLLTLVATHFDKWHIFAGLGLFLFFAGLWAFSGGRWMGFGDAKLALGMGFWLGPMGGVSAVILGFWLGAVVGLFLMAAGRSKRLSGKFKSFTMKTEIPFAPFLIIGLLLNLFFGFNVISF